MTPQFICVTFGVCTFLISGFARRSLWGSHVLHFGVGTSLILGFARRSCVPRVSCVTSLIPFPGFARSSFRGSLVTHVCDCRGSHVHWGSHVRMCDVSHCVLQCVAVCCSVLQCVAVCCSVLQCVAVSFSVFSLT